MLTSPAWLTRRSSKRRADAHRRLRRERPLGRLGARRCPGARSGTSRSSPARPRQGARRRHGDDRGRGRARHRRRPCRRPSRRPCRRRPRRGRPARERTPSVSRRTPVLRRSARVPARRGGRRARAAPSPRRRRPNRPGHRGCAALRTRSSSRRKRLAAPRRPRPWRAARRSRSAARSASRGALTSIQADRPSGRMSPKVWNTGDSADPLQQRSLTLGSQPAVRNMEHDHAWQYRGCDERQRCWPGSHIRRFEPSRLRQASSGAVPNRL